MELNRSLAISSKIMDLKKGNIIGVMEPEFPMGIIEGYWNNTGDYKGDNKKNRERVFTVPNTFRPQYF